MDPIGMIFEGSLAIPKPGSFISTKKNGKQLDAGGDSCYTPLRTCDPGHQESHCHKIPGFDPSASQAATVDLQKDPRGSDVPSTMEDPWCDLQWQTDPTVEVLPVHLTVKVLEEFCKDQGGVETCLRPDDASHL